MKKLLSYGSAALAALTLSLAGGSSAHAEDAKIYCESNITQVFSFSDGRVSVVGEGLQSTSGSVVICDPDTAAGKSCDAVLSQVQAAMLAGLKIRVRLPNGTTYTPSQCKTLTNNVIVAPYIGLVR
jgi:hypothetical protein